MTGQDLIDWICQNNAQDMTILADAGGEIRGYTVTRHITPTILPSAGSGIEKDGVFYSVVTPSEDVIVL